MRINPFEPNSPVNPGAFVGRLEEIDHLHRTLIQTKAGRPSHFMITGERGIGKSSLLNDIKFVAKGAIPIDEQKQNFLVLATDLDQHTTQFGLVKKIEMALRRELGQTEAIKKFLRDAWSFLSRIEAAGVKVRSENADESIELLHEEFAYTICDIAERVCHSSKESPFNAHYDGLLILIDEADKGQRDLHLGSFLKLFSERLSRLSCNHVMVGIAGLSELRTVLASSHPSSLRLMEELVLGRLSGNEVNMVIDICLEEAARLNGVEIGIEDAARKLLVLLSEGYPHFIQQFGYSAFAVDKDDLITGEDVQQGAFGKRGAMELIGDRYYRDNFYNKIQKEHYRQVLHIMADNLDEWVSKQDILKRFKGKPGTLDNAIMALRDRKIILSKEGERGVYRLQHKGFALWIKLYTSAPTAIQKTLTGLDNGTT